MNVGMKEDLSLPLLRNVRLMNGFKEKLLNVRIHRNFRKCFRASDLLNVNINFNDAVLTSDNFLWFEIS